MKKRLKKRSNKPKEQHNEYEGFLGRGAKDNANKVAFWLGGRTWTQSQMGAPAGTVDKHGMPGFNCTNYRAAWILATALEAMGIDSVRALCGLDIWLLDKRPGVGDTAQLVALKVIEHVGHRSSVYWSNGAKGKVKSYAFHVQADEAKARRKEKAA